MNANLSIEEMSRAGLQFGHKKSRVHPKMKPYLSGVRNTIYTIDLEKVKDKFEAALEYAEKIVSEGKTILIVGTKAQFKRPVKEMALACGMPYVSERWLGGTFTNYKIIKKRIDYFREQERKLAAGEFEKYTKKSRRNFRKNLKSWKKAGRY